MAGVSAETRGALLNCHSVRVGKRGAVIIPGSLRKSFGIEEGSLLIAEARPEGILLRPAAIYPVEVYTVERKAEFLLDNAGIQWAGGAADIGVRVGGGTAQSWGSGPARKA
ncbi:MAG: AbrB/MazE/SpoVT family DNA-binding domain-containing protein [Bacillota bacterium]|nr:AbrB/MazE/SpoVT family DNA-binding domain-containing protein [Bacillota bacterium]